MKRALRMVAAALALLLGAIAAAAALLLSTSAGARFALRFAEPWVPGQLTVGAITGSLAGGLVLEGLRFESATLEAVVDRATFVLAPRDLLQGLLRLELLAIAGVTVDMAADTRVGEDEFGGAETLYLPNLPRALAIEQVTLTDVTVSTRGRSLRLEQLTGSVARQRARITRLVGGVEELTLTYEGLIEVAAPRVAVDGTLSWQHGTESQSVVLRAELMELLTEGRNLLRLSWNELTWLRSDATTVTSAAGTLQVRPSTAEAELVAHVTLPMLDTVELRVVAARHDDLIEVSNLEIQAFGGRSTAAGMIHLEPTPRLVLEIALTDMAPPWPWEPALEPLSGKLLLTAEGGDVPSATAEGTLEARLGERTLRGQGALTYVDRSLTIERATLALANAQIELRGQAAPERLDVEFAATLPDLSNWNRTWNGALEAHGWARGPMQNPELSLELVAREVASTELALPPLTRTAVALVGRLHDHRVRATAITTQSGIDLHWQAGWENEALRGELHSLEVSTPELGRWQLTNPARFALSRRSLELTKTCVTGSPGGELCATLTPAESGHRLTATARSVPNALLGAWLPSGTVLHGHADARAELMLDEGPLRGYAELHEPTLRVSTQSQATDLTVGSIAALRVRADLAADKATLALSSSTAARDHVNGIVTLMPPGARGRLDGELAVRISDLSVLGPLTDIIDDPGGEATAILQLGGTAVNPRVAGTVRAESLRGHVPRLGIVLRDGFFAIEADDLDAPLRLTGQICSKGCIELTGALQQTREGWSLSTDIRGEAIEVIALDRYQAVAEPDLTLTRGGDGLWHVTGNAKVVEALLALEGPAVTAIRPSADAVLHGIPATRDEQPPDFPLTANLGLALDNVAFRGFGADAELRGMLEVERTAAGDLLLQGTARIEQGRFVAYRQELTIEPGSLLSFSGPIDNPALDIRATREVENGIVGVHIQGTAQSPRSTLFSEPSRTETESLALLVTGRSLTNLGSADGAALEQTVLGLGLTRAGPLLDRIGSVLGLDALSVGGPGSASGALVASKTIGDNLLIRYRYGLFDTLAGLELIYRVNERLRLRSDTGATQAVDLIYDLDPDDNAVSELGSEPGFDDGNEPVSPSVLGPGPLSAPN